MILLSVLLIITLFLKEEADDYAMLTRCIGNLAPDEHRQIALVSSYVILKQCIHSLVWLASYYLLIY
jgi:hypothetical protein